VLFFSILALHHFIFPTLASIDHLLIELSLVSVMIKLLSFTIRSDFSIFKLIFIFDIIDLLLFIDLLFIDLLFRFI
jgi:hypothetical protein